MESSVSSLSGLENIGFSRNITVVLSCAFLIAVLLFSNYLLQLSTLLQSLYWVLFHFSLTRVCSVQSCLTLCNPIDCSTPGFPVHPKSWSLHKVRSIESVMPSKHLILCCPLLLLPLIFPSSGSFPVSQFFPSGGQRIGVLASGSVLSMNVQNWFPLRLTGLISL